MNEKNCVQIVLLREMMLLFLVLLIWALILQTPLLLNAQTERSSHPHLEPKQQPLPTKNYLMDNQGFKAHVNSVLKDKEQNILVCANQEACVLDLEKHRPVKITNLPYPKENFPESVFSENFERFPVQIEESDFKYEQKIYSQHIDMSYHMNNIEYIKLALNIFSNDFLLHNEVSSLEVHFTGESREGENLRVYSRNLDGSFFIFIKESERTVFEMKIEFQSSL